MADDGGIYGNHMGTGATGGQYGGAIQKDANGYNVSGGGLGPEGWAAYYERMKNAKTGADVQAAYDSLPMVQAQKAAAANASTNRKPQAAGSTFYQYGDPTLINPATGGTYGQGQYAEQKSAEANMLAAQQATREAPQADFTNANNGALAAALRLNQAHDINADQTRLGQHLAAAALGQGPSVAELAMRRAAAEQTHRNLAMAAGGAGPGSTAALINATNQNQLAGGQLQQNLGVQRAAEQVQARTELGNLLAQQRGATAGEAGQYGTLGQVAGQQAIANAGLQAGQNVLNQQGQQYMYGQGADWVRGQAGLNAQQGANWNNYTVGQTSNANQANIAQQQHNDQMLGAGLSAAGAITAAALTPVTGGATAPAAVALGANAVKQGAAASNPQSDIRAKTAIAPAGGEVSQAYRGIASANDDASKIRGAEVQYPSPFSPTSASSYMYKDPNAPGAEPGQHFGPMAQELEKTPAGASVVTTMPNGSKGIDTGRLALLNASETGQLRREVDAMKGGGSASKGSKLNRLRAANDRKEAALSRLLGERSDRAASAIATAPGSFQSPLRSPPMAAYPY